MGELRLITIPMSHYCEKARWALDRLGLTYREERHIQGLHYPRTWWVSRNPAVPVLVDGGRVIVDSTNILKHLDSYAAPGSRLYPGDTVECREVEALEEWFDEVLGVESRRWIYFHYLPHGRAFRRLAAQGAPWLECVAAAVAYPAMSRFATRLLQAYPKAVEAGLAQSREIVREVDAMLADGRAYLVGGRFTAADLTLACMLAPFVAPPEYGIRVPAVHELPAAMQPCVRQFRATATGSFVLRLFREQRHRGCRGR